MRQLTSLPRGPLHIDSLHIHRFIRSLSTNTCLQVGIQHNNWHLSELGTIGDLISHIRDTQVAAEAVVDAIVPGGKRLRDEEMHLWNVNAAGKVTRFRHFLDTVKHQRAAAG